MNGENLAHDWEFNIAPDAPLTEWAFNWKYAEGGTATPMARPHHATLWQTLNLDDPIATIKNFYKSGEELYQMKLEVVAPMSSETEDDDDDATDDDELSEYDENVWGFKVLCKRTNNVLMTGCMYLPDEQSSDPNVGYHAVFQSTTKAGTSLMKKLVDDANSDGVMVMVEHTVSEIVFDKYAVTTVTGHGPDEDKAAPRDGSCGDLATRFTMHDDNDEEIARCHMTYCDATWDHSIGPTIEMLEVEQSRRGEGISKVMWFWVRRFIEEHFSLECLSDDAPLNHIMVKVTQIGLCEIDIRVDPLGGRKHPVTFKDFVFDFCGFSVRVPKGYGAFMNTRPLDEEAILYIPRKQRGSVVQQPPWDPVFRQNCGARMCSWCRKITVRLSKCGRCGVAHYCNRSCAKNDRKRHKKWCGKTREQVRALVVEEGYLTQEPDGRWGLCMNLPT